MKITMVKSFLAKTKINFLFWQILFLIVFFTILFVYGADDNNPPVISNIKILEVGTSSAVISWQTNKSADSIINYGLDRNYGLVREAIFDTEHQLVLDNLLANTTYYFQVVSTDAAGNQNVVKGYNFTTKKLVEVPGAEQFGEEGKLVEKAYEAISQIKGEKALEFLSEKVEELGAERIETPVLIGDPRVEVGEDWAKISWKTNKETNSIIAFASEDQYKPNDDDPYQTKVGEPNEYVLEHLVEISGLKPATTYHFQVQSAPKVGPSIKSEDRTFTTKSILPQILNLQIVKVEEDAVTLSWLTNVPCSTLVEYTNFKNREAKQVGDPTFLTVHKFRISNLEFDTTYQAIVKAENEQGDKTQSQPINFTTVKDEAPPVIANITLDSTLFPGEEKVRVQTVVSWKTDEKAVCQLFYQEGIAEGVQVNSLALESEYMEKHVQVISDFAPNTTYKYWIVCKDKTGNETKSENYTLLTPTKEKSILDIIIENIESTFGWVKKIKM